MTRKDYVLIAEAINRAIADIHPVNAVYMRILAKRLALALAKDNPRFDSDRFLDACFKKVDIPS